MRKIELTIYSVKDGELPKAGCSLIYWTDMGFGRAGPYVGYYEDRFYEGMSNQPAKFVVEWAEIPRG